MNDEQTTTPDAPETPAPEAEETVDPAARAEEYLNALQRERADFLNYKRRIETEGRQVASAAMMSVVERLLPVVDDFELAANSVEPHVANLPWTQGVLAVQRKLEGVLASLDVKAVDCEGKPFDPRLCEALMEGEGPEGIVVAVLQRGYTMGDQLVRPARVIVGRGGGTAPAAAQKSAFEPGEG